MDNHSMNFANTINEIGSFGVKGQSECFNFGITWGCRPHCPVFERGKCEHQEENQAQFDREEVSNG